MAKRFAPGGGVEVTSSGSASEMDRTRSECLLRNRWNPQDIFTRIYIELAAAQGNEMTASAPMRVNKKGRGHITKFSPSGSVNRRMHIFAGSQGC
jgi:hypothetical protein